MIENLRKINEKMLIKYKDNNEALKRQLIISSLLKNDDCFFKISMEDAYNILNDLEIINYQETYLQLISYLKYIEKS